MAAISTVDEKLEFAAKYIRDPKGKKFTIKGREWVREFWRALEGFKAWPVDRDKLCDACAKCVGTIIDSPSDIRKCRKRGCKRLKAEPILFVVLSADRRTGKTFNCGAFVLAKIFNDSWEHINYVATAEDQTQSLVRDNFTGPVLNSPTLKANSRVVGHKIEVPRRKSVFEFTSTAPSAVTGKGGHFFVDEARDVEARVLSAILPSIQEQSGLSCTKCSYRAPAQSKKKKCPQCSAELRRWYGRVCIMSAAGIITDDPNKDWFYNLVCKLENEPDPNAYLFRMDDSSVYNPDVVAETKTASKRLFGSLEGMKAMMDVEFDNEFRRVGDKFLSEGDVDVNINKQLHNADQSERTCIAFLDTSKVSDLTSLLIYSSDDFGDTPFEYAKIERIDVWDPRARDRRGNLVMPYGIEPESIQATLDEVLPRFPTCLGVWVDIRGKAVPWAQRLLDFCKKERGYGRKMHGFEGGSKERNAGWAELERLVLARKIQLPNTERLIKELKNAVWKIYKGNLQVRETNNRKLHLELAESLATCCYLAYAYGTKEPKRGYSDLGGGASGERSKPATSGFRLGRSNVNSF